MKVVKAYSLDIETVALLESHHKDAYGEIGSRSATVDSAIRWYLTGNVAELVENNKNLVKAVQRANKSRLKDQQGGPPRISWWRRLLLGQREEQ